MSPPTHIDPVVSFHNMQGEAVCATILKLQRRALVMEVYNPWSIVQVSEVLSELTIRIGERSAYVGKAVVVGMVNSGLTAIVSVSLTDEWLELHGVALQPGAIGRRARAFVAEWSERFQVRRDYQIVVNEMRAFLADSARWLEQLDLADATLGGHSGAQLPAEYFAELAVPLTAKIKACFDQLNHEAALVDEELAPAHRAFAQAALHPLLLRAPFLFRTYTKPLGYAGDHQTVDQMLGAPRKGPNTYCQVVNTAFLQTAVPAVYRQRVDVLAQHLAELAGQARAAGRPFRVLCVGCGPAAEIAHFLRTFDEPGLLTFELMDLSAETLAWTRGQLETVQRETGRRTALAFAHDSVHQLLKRRDRAGGGAGDCDAVYCAGLFDYLSDKVCARLTACFATRLRPGGRLLVTGLHRANPDRHGMEHLLEWYLVHRDEERMAALLPARRAAARVYTDPAGVGMFAEATLP